MCVIRPGQLPIVARVPANAVNEFRRKNPGARACPPARRRAVEPIDTNRLLDIGNDGSFSGAWRAATLAHEDPAATADAIRRLVRAADDGRIGDQFAGEQVARLASPTLAASQIELRAEPLTLEQLAERRRRREAGLSDSKQLAAQIAKLNEACTPRVCYMSGDRVTGKVTAINFVTISAEQAAASPFFIRFCSKDDLQAAGHLDTEWGEWFGDRIRKAGAALGLAAPPAPRVLTVALAAGAPPPPPPSGAFVQPTYPNQFYLMCEPGGNSAIVPGWQVPQRLTQGWRLC